MSPRVFRVVALPAPTEREHSQMYMQRYVPHFPAAGEVVIFDRSWYNRAGVERVMGFCTLEETERFLEQAPPVEKAMVDSGILLLKYWLEVSPKEQTRRLERRINDPRKVWKLSDISHLLSQVPYKPLVHNDVTLPKRQRARGYVEPDLPLRYIPTPC